MTVGITTQRQAPPTPARDKNSNCERFYMAYNFYGNKNNSNTLYLIHVKLNERDGRMTK